MTIFRQLFGRVGLQITKELHGVSSTLTFNIVKGKGKGKAIPLQAWTGPKGSRTLRLPDFKTIST